VGGAQRAARRRGAKVMGDDSRSATVVRIDAVIRTTACRQPGPVTMSTDGKPCAKKWSELKAQAISRRNRDIRR